LYPAARCPPSLGLFPLEKFLLIQAKYYTPCKQVLQGIDTNR
jgi:hypothetical protein